MSEKKIQIWQNFPYIEGATKYFYKFLFLNYRIYNIHHFISFMSTTFFLKKEINLFVIRIFIINLSIITILIFFVNLC